jgi:hypothetical protein
VSFLILARLARHFEEFMRAMSLVAEQRESEVAVRLREHLGTDPKALPTTGTESSLTEHANLQLALDAVLVDAELLGFAIRPMGLGRAVWRKSLLARG